MTQPSNPETVIINLTPAQADGMACVHCNLPTTTTGAAFVPVGRSTSGSQVFACSPACPAETEADRAAQAAHAEWEADRAAQDAAMARLADARRAAHCVLDRYDAAPLADLERQEWRATIGAAALAELRALLGAVEQEDILLALPQPEDTTLPPPDAALIERLRAAADPVPEHVKQAARDVFQPRTPSHMDRTHPDGVVVGDPAPAGMIDAAFWHGRCHSNSPGSAGYGYQCSRPVGHDGRHLAVGPEAGDGSGLLVVLATWPADSGWVSA